MPSKVYTIKDGDSLQSIAQRELGDASRWVDIALLNDLSYPFIVGYGEAQSGAATPGDTILLPTSEASSDSYLPTMGNPLDEIFGVDLLLSSDNTNLSFGKGGDFSTDLDGDLVVTTGVQSLTQDLIHRLVTPLGSLPYHPEYGSPFLDIIGNKKNKNWLDKAVIYLIRTFKSDDRVQDVVDVILTELNQGIMIDCRVVTEVTIFQLNQVIGGGAVGA